MITGGEASIEITDAMIRAGVARLSAYLSYEKTDTAFELIVAEVYEAMASMRR